MCFPAVLLPDPPAGSIHPPPLPPSPFIPPIFLPSQTPLLLNVPTILFGSRSSSPPTPSAPKPASVASSLCWGSTLTFIPRFRGGGAELSPWLACTPETSACGGFRCSSATNPEVSRLAADSEFCADFRWLQRREKMQLEIVCEAQPVVAGIHRRHFWALTAGPHPSPPAPQEPPRSPPEPPEPSHVSQAARRGRKQTPALSLR